MIDMMEKGEEMIQMRRLGEVEEPFCANHNQGKSTRHFPVIGQILVIGPVERYLHSALSRFHASKPPPVSLSL